MTKKSGLIPACAHPLPHSYPDLRENPARWRPLGPRACGWLTRAADLLVSPARPFAFCLILAFNQGWAQEKFTLSGFVRDSVNGEALIGASVYLPETGTGSTSNTYGFYSITLPASAYTVQVSYIGYASLTQQTDLNQNIRLDIQLSPATEQLSEVVITGEGDRPKVSNLAMSRSKLDINTIRKLPAFLGEVDVIKSLQMLPGVSTVGEGASGFNVRGGSAGQNLILLDEAPVYNASHMLGFFSTFNPDAVKDVQLYKGAIPARYGGRLASILDVRMKEGNVKGYDVEGGIGTIFSRLSFEGPIVKDKGSFIVAARRSYIDVLARPFVDVLADGGALNFYDLTIKGNYHLNENSRLYASGYFGRDNFLFDRNQGFDWGNATTTLRWNHLFNDRLFFNLTGVYSSYDYHLQFRDDDLNRFDWRSSISNFMIKPEFSYFVSSRNEWNFGLESTYYFFEPAKATGVSNGVTTNISLDKRYNLETALYIGNSWDISGRLAVEYGLRFSDFEYFGPGTAYSYYDTIPGERRRVRAATGYGRGGVIASYQNLEPRFSLRLLTSERTSVKASYNRMVQYLHLISNTTASNPLDVWTPSSNNILPELGDQYTLGYFLDAGPERQWHTSVEVYLRLTDHQIDYIDGADLLINRYLEGDLLSGEGRAYGLELYAERTAGPLTGWISYTLARTEQKVPGVNQGSWYPTRYDQTHNFKAGAFYQASTRVGVAADFVFLSGTPTTFPTSRYVIQGMLIPYNAYDTRNNVRIPPYHRLDVSLHLEGRRFNNKGKERKNRDECVFSIYNVYARHNPFSIYFAQPNERHVAGDPLMSRARQLSIVGSMVPAVSYNFHF